jgi:hypothetical protein
MFILYIYIFIYLFICLFIVDLFNLFLALGWRMVCWQHTMNMKILFTALSGHQLTHGHLRLLAMMAG